MLRTGAAFTPAVGTQESVDGPFGPVQSSTSLVWQGEAVQNGMHFRVDYTSPRPASVAFDSSSSETVSLDEGWGAFFVAAQGSGVRAPVGWQN